tara:strand:+ start:2399 stop:2815 length:417 start_codon:yes stop_codon:yes gene_type:complete
MNSLKKEKKLTKNGKIWVKAAIKDMEKREKEYKKKERKKKKKSIKKNNKKRKKRFIQNISLKKYKELIKKKRTKKRLTKKERRLLSDALFYKYCKCNLNFEDRGENGYGICMNSIYKNRGFKTPNLKKGNRCKDIYKK